MEDFKSDSSIGRIVKNGFYTALRFGVYTLIAMFFVPFLVKRYGSGAYGLIALAGFLTQYVGMISGCVGGAVARFLIVGLNKNDWDQANEIFSTALFANIVIMLIQLPIYALGVWKLNWLIDFPPELALDFRILVICNILIFFLNTATGILFTPLFAANRLDLSSKLDLLRQMLRVSLLAGLILRFGAKLWMIGVVDLGLNLFFLLPGYFIYRRLAKHLVFKLSHVTMKWVRPVLSMAGWSLVAMLGYSFFVSSDVWLINRFVSKEMAGVYAALLIWPNFIIQVGGQVSSLISPVYMIDFARGDQKRMMKICLLVNKILGLFAAFAVGFIFVFSKDILNLWLGSEYIRYSLLLGLMAVGLPLTLGGAVVWCVFPAINKTHYTGISNLVTGALNIGLSLLLVKLGMGVYGVAIGTLVCTVLKSTAIESYWVAKELNSPYRRFLFNYAAAISVFLVIWGVNQLFQSSGLWVHGGIYLSISIALLPILLYAAFSDEERLWLYARVGKLFNARR